MATPAPALPPLSPLDTEVGPFHDNVYNNDRMTEEQARAFLMSISPPRDLVCPITLTIFYDPVLALGDGQTYERHAIETWLRAQQGRNSTVGDVGGVTGIRSPVTNAYMEDRHAMTVIPNKVACDMAGQFRETLGKKLLGYVHTIDEPVDRNGNQRGELGDGGFRIRNLVEMGADLSVVDHRGHSAFEWLIQKRRLELARFLLSHHRPRSLGDHDGQSSSSSTTTSSSSGVALTVIASVDLIKQVIEDMTQNSSDSWDIRAWQEFLSVVELNAQVEKDSNRRREEVREVHNVQQRERQRVLATDHARNVAARNGGGENGNGIVINGAVIRNALGNLEEGMGFFPSLCALQFQGNVPPPPASFAEAEEREKKRLDFIVKCASGLILVIWILG